MALDKGAADEFWLSVEDNGIGMSEAVLTGPFLDFGKSYWSSPQAQSELPGILSRGFRSTGRYGIGFFSVFMLGDQVQVITRRPAAARQDTLVLDFQHGLRSRPLLRAPVSEGEWLRDGGTRVRVKLSRAPYTRNGLLAPVDYRPRPELPEALGALCASIDADLYVKHLGQPRALVVRASDWATMDPSAFLLRLWGREAADRDPSLLSAVAQNMRILCNTDGSLVGRAALCPRPSLDSELGRWAPLGGKVTCGGLHATDLTGVAGVLVGVPSRASRDDAVPLVEWEALADWAAEQAAIAAAAYGPWADSRFRLASFVAACRADPSPLPVCQTAAGRLSLAELSEWAAGKDEIIVSLDAEQDLFEYGLVLAPNALQTDLTRSPLSRSQNPWPPEDHTDTLWEWVAEEIAEAWEVPLEDLPHERLEQAPIGTLAGNLVTGFGFRLTRPATSAGRH